ncbi:hypothetical protein BKA64DRAFT_648877 [Cadophora sp. MPI-SDFR-AT-0126]|nr:hypothetical protein BKA64DRAFT_648877 [Leotiomycetes sp. MPI-SDFR-AT-0126]
MSSMTFNEAVNGTIMVGVHDRNYKGGAFKSLVPRGMDTVQALNIFLNSPLLSAADKSDIRSLLSQYLMLNARFTGGAEPGLMDTIDVSKSLDRIMDMFDSDARARGEYVPPSITLQSLNDDHSVKETHVWDETAQIMVPSQGGVAGVPPGAPPGFSGVSGVAIGKKEKASEKKPKGDTQKSSKDDKSEFGDGFSKNVRGAFC